MPGPCLAARSRAPKARPSHLHPSSPSSSGHGPAVTATVLSAATANKTSPSSSALLLACVWNSLRLEFRVQSLTPKHSFPGSLLPFFQGFLFSDWTCDTCFIKESSLKALSRFAGIHPLCQLSKRSARCTGSVGHLHASPQILQPIDHAGSSQQYQQHMHANTILGPNWALNAPWTLHWSEGMAFSNQKANAVFYFKILRNSVWF